MPNKEAETLDAFQTGPAVPQIANAVLETVSVSNRIFGVRNHGMLVHP